MKVLVAGAGLSGLHAAWHLRRAGHDVTVCEARDRVGGRVWSTQLDNGAWIERGGEFIFPLERCILGLCARLGLPVIPHGFSFFRRASPHGAAPTVDQLCDVLERVSRVLSSGRLPEGAVPAGSPDPAGCASLSVADAFEAALGASYGADPVFLRTATSMTVDPRLASAEGELGADAVDRTLYLDHSFHVVGGNQRIAAHLAAGLGGGLRLESPVQSVDQTRAGVELTLTDGSCLAADVAVIALPLPILGDLERGFPWPEPVERALGARLMGTALKASVALHSGAVPRGVQSPQRWWAWNSVSPDDSWSGLAATAIASTACASTACASTPADLARAPTADIPWHERIQRLRPDLEVDGEALVTDWAQDVWTRGSYTVPALAWTPADDRAYTTPIGRVVLAGEHTSPTNGTMNGALQSGERAAHLLLACFG